VVPTVPVSRRILLVDDEPALLYAIEAYLGERGYEVHSASELARANAMLAARSYDVVVTDMRLSASPHAEGLNVIRYIRDHGLTARVVVLTGTAGQETESQARELGIDRFLHKPVPLAELAGIVDDLVS
jgi:DNA-binding response OmpR family regulator